MDYLQPIFIVAIGCGIAVGIGLYIYHRHAKSAPASPPATVSHIAALSNEIKAVAAKVETSTTLGAIKQRVEDLHDKIDKKEAK